MPVLGDTLDEDNETFTVILSSPVGAIIGTGTGTGTITDNDATPSLSINNVTVTEGNTGSVNAVFTVTLSAASNKTVTVNYATANGTAVAPADYTAASGVLTFAPGTVTQPITVPVIGDTLDEPNETFTVNLSGPPTPRLPMPGRRHHHRQRCGTATISIADASVTEGNSGTKNMTFTVTLSAASGQTVSANYATQCRNGVSALTGDYTADQRDVDHSRRDRRRGPSTCRSVATRPSKPNETFFVNLSAAVNAAGIARRAGHRHDPQRRLKRQTGVAFTEATPARACARSRQLCDSLPVPQPIPSIMSRLGHVFDFRMAGVCPRQAATGCQQP